MGTLATLQIKGTEIDLSIDKFGNQKMLPNRLLLGLIISLFYSRNRTTVMSILAGLGLIIFPLGIALGGQIYAWAGYYAVYACSFVFNILGLIYIYFVPESITTRNVESVEE